MTHLQLTRSNVRTARKMWGRLSCPAITALKEITEKHDLSISSGDLCFLEGRWYVTHTGLLQVAQRNRCSGMHVQPVRQFCNPATGRWAFRATVYKNRNCKGFVGYGDADPSNVSALVRGAEMRVAETRAVNRALRKAYGIGICSVEEIGSLPPRSQVEANVRKLPPQSVDGNGEAKLRDQLCLLIRRYRLDASLVKQYAGEFCGTKDIRHATRQQIQSFIAHLAEFAGKDRDELLRKLNSYGQGPEAGAA